jgi:hypothetical protein
VNIPESFYSVIPMNELAESISLKKLPVLATIGETLEVSWKHRKVLALWIVGCTIFSGSFCYLMENLFAHFSWVYAGWRPIWVRVFFIFLAAIPLSMVGAMFSVFCHRLVLMGGENESLFAISFGKREWRFIGWEWFLSLATILIVFLVIIVSAFGIGFLKIIFESYENFDLIRAIVDNYLFTALFYGVGSYAIAGYCLVLPATALDLKPSLAWSSEKTKGNELRLALLFGGLPFIFGFLYCPPSLLTWLQIDHLMVVKHAVRPFLVYMVTPIVVIAISIAFRELTNWTPYSQLHEST